MFVLIVISFSYDFFLLLSEVYCDMNLSPEAEVAVESE